LIPSLLLKAYGSTLKAQVTYKRLRAAVINAWRRRLREGPKRIPPRPLPNSPSMLDTNDGGPFEGLH